MTAHTAEQLAHEQRRYLQVFAWLTFLTDVELAVIYMHISHLNITGMLPSFAITERGGDVLHTQDLAGHVWIADFVFSHCPDICLALTGRFTRLQRELDGVWLVSFSVDPTRDTPEVLREYVTRAGP